MLRQQQHGNCSNKWTEWIHSPYTHTCTHLFFFSLVSSFTQSLISTVCIVCLCVIQCIIFLAFLIWAVSVYILDSSNLCAVAGFFFCSCCYCLTYFEMYLLLLLKSYLIAAMNIFFNNNNNKKRVQVVAFFSSLHHLHKHSFTPFY